MAINPAVSWRRIIPASPQTKCYNQLFITAKHTSRSMASRKRVDWEVGKGRGEADQ